MRRLKSYCCSLPPASPNVEVPRPEAARARSRRMTPRKSQWFSKNPPARPWIPIYFYNYCWGARARLLGPSAAILSRLVHGERAYLLFVYSCPSKGDLQL